MGDPGTVRHAGGPYAQGPLGLDCFDLRSRRSAREPGAAILDAAGSRDAASQRTRRDGLHAGGILCSYAGGFSAGDAARLDASLSAIGKDDYQKLALLIILTYSG